MDAGQTHILNLARKEADDSGWAKVSAIVWDMIADIDHRLLERDFDNRKVRLTPEGELVLEFA